MDDHSTHCLWFGNEEFAAMVQRIAETFSCKVKKLGLLLVHAVTWPIISIYDTKSSSCTFKEMRENSVLVKAVFHPVVLC